MLRNLFTPNTAQNITPREGELYKAITIDGHTFEIYYGFYEEVDRRYDPIAIYPDFTKEPVYTDAGIPFATQMQDICRCYIGEHGEDGCGSCAYFKKSTDLFGLCTCEQRRKQK